MLKKNLLPIGTKIKITFQSGDADCQMVGWEGEIIEHTKWDGELKYKVDFNKTNSELKLNFLFPADGKPTWFITSEPKLDFMWEVVV